MKDNRNPVLVVDDSNAARMQICSIIENAGYNTVQANNGKVALEMIDEFDLSAILLDLLMPEMDGFDVLKIMKEKHISIPVIILSADIQDEVKQECFDLGAVGFLNKPFKAQDIIDAILNLSK
jgi:CheY-like chemotaxis protein